MIGKQESRRDYNQTAVEYGNTVDRLVRQLGEESPTDRLIAENIDSAKSLQLLISLGKITEGDVHSFCINKNIPNPLETSPKE